MTRCASTSRVMRPLALPPPPRWLRGRRACVAPLDAAFTTACGSVWQQAGGRGALSVAQ